MRRSKKLIIGAVLGAVVLVGSITGVVLAQTQNGNDSQSGANNVTLLDRACEIYQQKTGAAINQTVLKDAFAQAQKEMRTEALQNRLQSLVDQGRLTQQQADDYLKWWEAKPDVPAGFGFQGRGGIRGGPGLCLPGNWTAPQPPGNQTE